MEIYIDGEWHSRETARISVFDHGLLYGDGVFEGIRVYNRRIFRLADHLRRLYDSARAIALEIPLDRDAMSEAVRQTVRRNQRADGYIRLVVTRGAGELGIDPKSCPKPSVIIIATDVAVYPPELYAEGIRVVTCGTRQISQAALDSRIKSLNYLKNILAKIEARNAGAEEAILLNEAGFIAECTADNLFVVRDGRLLTPDPTDGALAGITRAAVLQLAGEAGIPCAETRLGRYDVYTADECFVTGTGAEIVHCRRVDGRTIGDGSAGPITTKLRDAFHRLARNEGAPVF